MIYVKGSNLFETLMRNLMFLQDGGELWEPDVPCWELEDARSGERTEVACPDNFAELMTTQFRRILLERKENKVVGYTVLGGDFFDSTNAFAEPMTLWNKKRTKRQGWCITIRGNMRWENSSGGSFPLSVIGAAINPA